MKTWCVIVCYRPQVEILNQLCHDITSDDGHVILVDNTEPPTLTKRDLTFACTLITLGTNTGIAHAQNVGIDIALANGAKIISFFDQDSILTDGFLRRLTTPLRLGRPDMVSPVCLDSLNGKELPAIKISARGISKTIYRDGRTEPYGVDVVIASGSAMTSQVFDVAGRLDESLFIDYVDTEWCIRCRAKGIPIRVVPDAVMHHRIGSQSIDTSLMTIQVHNPIRCYYQLRNCFVLFRKAHIPFFFTMMQLVSVSASRLLLLLFVDQRWAYLDAYISAFADGVRGIAGRNPRDLVA